MCWTIRTLNDKPTIRIASEDIECFKVVSMRPLYYLFNIHFGKDKIFSFYRNYLYKLNKLYKLEKSLDWGFNPVQNYFFINRGFHSYSSEVCEAIIGFRGIDVVRVRNSSSPKECISSYYDVYNSKVRKPFRVKVIKCIIPKGSEYAINSKGELVSNQIILKEIV